MRIRSMGMSVAMMMGAVLPFAAAFADERIEIPVEGVLAPENGYDDNDNVEVVAHGNLPNACYTLADAFVGHAEDGVTIRIRQYAIRRTEGICAEREPLPAHLALSIPFTREIQVGRLPATSYGLEYLGEDGEFHKRLLNVGTALTPSIDNQPYAVVTNAVTPDRVNGVSDIRVTVRGVLNSTCTELDQVRVSKEKDVFVILPTVKVKIGVYCSEVLVPYERKLNLGRATPGHYLVHVRSMNGRSVNRVFEVGRR